MGEITSPRHARDSGYAKGCRDIDAGVQAAAQAVFDAWEDPESESDDEEDSGSDMDVEMEG